MATTINIALIKMYTTVKKKTTKFLVNPKKYNISNYLLFPVFSF